MGQPQLKLRPTVRQWTTKVLMSTPATAKSFTLNFSCALMA